MAQVAAWYVRDALERQIVAEDDHAQIRERVLDLFAVEELHAAVDDVGNLLFDERFLNGARCVMGAVQHADIAQLHAFAHEIFYLTCNPGSFVSGALRVIAERFGPWSAHGGEVFWHAMLVCADERVRRHGDLRSRAVVLVHHDGVRASKALVEIEQVFHVGPTPSVDGLIGIADDEQVAMIASEHLHELVLKPIDVLELVDHDIFEPFLPFEAQVLSAAEDLEREDNQVVVIEAEAFLLLIEIAVEQDVVGLFG